jgi:hypothetical protein
MNLVRFDCGYITHYIDMCCGPVSVLYESLSFIIYGILFEGSIDLEKIH